MRVGLVIETLAHRALALTTSPWVAMPVFFVGAHAFVWGTTSVTVRQRAVPQALQGRVGNVNLVGVYGGLVIGSAIGRAGPGRRPHGSGLVRVRRIGGLRRTDLASARAHRPRGRAAANCAGCGLDHGLGVICVSGGYLRCAGEPQTCA